MNSLCGSYYYSNDNNNDNNNSKLNPVFSKDVEI